MYNVSISTMWGIGRFDHMADFASRGKALGFCCIELNHQLTDAGLREILAVYREGGVSISSVHDPCPNNVESLELLPNVSALDEGQRSLGVASVKRTIDLAHRLHAKAVVLHAGDVRQLRESALALRKLFKSGKRNTPEYQLALMKFKSNWAQLQQPHLDAVVHSLEDLIPYAQTRQVKLGLENRYYVNEIPDLQQAAWLLNRFTGAGIGYWHDVGHAEVQERMGFAAHSDWLETLRARIIGVHLHDVLESSITDHQAAGLGDLDFPMIQRHLPATALRVCEFDKKNTEEQVAAGLQHLASLGFFPQQQG